MEELELSRITLSSDLRSSGRHLSSKRLRAQEVFETIYEDVSPSSVSGQRANPSRSDVQLPRVPLQEFRPSPNSALCELPLETLLLKTYFDQSSSDVRLKMDLNTREDSDKDTETLAAPSELKSSISGSSTIRSDVDEGSEDMSAEDSVRSLYRHAESLHAAHEIILRSVSSAAESCTKKFLYTISLPSSQSSSASIRGVCISYENIAAKCKEALCNEVWQDGKGIGRQNTLFSHFFTTFPSRDGRHVRFVSISPSTTITESIVWLIEQEDSKFVVADTFLLLRCSVSVQAVYANENLASSLNRKKDLSTKTFTSLIIVSAYEIEDLASCIVNSNKALKASDDLFSESSTVNISRRQFNISSHDYCLKILEGLASQDKIGSIPSIISQDLVWRDIKPRFVDKVGNRRIFQRRSGTNLDKCRVARALRGSILIKMLDVREDHYLWVRSMYDYMYRDTGFSGAVVVYDSAYPDQISALVYLYNGVVTCIRTTEINVGGRPYFACKVELDSGFFRALMDNNGCICNYDPPQSCETFRRRSDNLTYPKGHILQKRLGAQVQRVKFTSREISSFEEFKI